MSGDLVEPGTTIEYERGRRRVRGEVLAAIDVPGVWLPLVVRLADGDVERVVVCPDGTVIEPVALADLIAAGRQVRGIGIAVQLGVLAAAVAAWPPAGPTHTQSGETR